LASQNEKHSTQRKQKCENEAAALPSHRNRRAGFRRGNTDNSKKIAPLRDSPSHPIVKIKDII
jgi:hypothetical protein